MKDTSMRLSEELWEHLHHQKKMGESMDDVIRRLVKFKKKEGRHDNKKNI